MKAQEYDESARPALSESPRPRPLSICWGTRSRYLHEPWIGDEHFPKSVVREMIENALTPTDRGRYDAAASERASCAT